MGGPSRTRCLNKTPKGCHHHQGATLVARDGKIWSSHYLRTQIAEVLHSNVGRLVRLLARARNEPSPSSHVTFVWNAPLPSILLLTAQLSSSFVAYACIPVHKPCHWYLHVFKNGKFVARSRQDAKSSQLAGVFQGKLTRRNSYP